MAKVKIFLDKNETIEDAEESLYKALDLHRNGNNHVDSFTDPAMIDLDDKLVELHKQMFKALLDEVLNELDDEYNNDNI